MVDSGHFEKLKNLGISVTDLPILTKSFCMVVHTSEAQTLLI